MKFRQTGHSRNVDFVIPVKNSNVATDVYSFRAAFAGSELLGYLTLTHAAKCLPTILFRCLECAADGIFRWASFNSTGKRIRNRDIRNSAAYERSFYTRIDSNVNCNIIHEV